MEPTKLSFSLPSSKQQQNPNKRPSSSAFEQSIPLNQTPYHEFVTEFDPSKTLTHSNQQPTHSSIPRLENTWQPHYNKKLKNLEIPLHSTDNDPDRRFELEAPTAADDETSMAYGLNVRALTDEDKKEERVEAAVRPISVENVIHQRFKEDMKNLPEDRGMEEFVDVPVEGFGAALLKAYGWKEGQGIGKNAKEDVKVVQYVRRGDKEGLGFLPSEMPVVDKNGPKASQQKQLLVAPKGLDGKTRHVVGIDEKLVLRELKGIHVGKIVRVVSGRHVGLKGKVLEKFDDGQSGLVMVVLKLRSDEQVTVGIRDVAGLGSFDEERCLEDLIDKADKRKPRKRDSLSYRERDEKKKDKRRNAEEEKSVKKEEKYGNGAAEKRSKISRDYVKEEEKVTLVSWLTSHIRVRIISKDFKGGKLYLKKGTVVDVVGPNVCDISLDDTNQLIQGVDQDILETAVPKPGGPVLILYGKHKGVFGYLREKNMKKETCVVQDADNHELLNVQLEQVAEYIGDPSVIGY